MFNPNRLLRSNNKNENKKEIFENFYNLEKYGLKIMSDESLRQEDLIFMSKVKDNLDRLLNDNHQKKIKVIISNAKNWGNITKSLNLKTQKFTGESIEVPLKQTILLPSFNVITLKSTRYNQFLKLAGEDAEIKESLLRLTEYEKKELYKTFYLRNMFTHELAHMYQFSSRELDQLSQFTNDSNEQMIKQSKFLHLREWISCAFGLYSLQYEPSNRKELFIKINHIAAKKLLNMNKEHFSADQRYPFEQANRTIQAKKFFNICKKLELDNKSLLIKMSKICKSDDLDLKQQLQEVLTGEITIGTVNNIINILNQWN